MSRRHERSLVLERVLRLLLRQAEVEHLDAPVVADHHVGRLEVAVRDAPVVCRAYRISERNTDLEQLVERHPALRDALRKRPAVHQLHREKEHALVLLDRVDRDDTWVVESGDGARFAFEAGAAIGVVGGIVRQDLERHLASELRVLSKVHLAHAAGA